MRISDWSSDVCSSDLLLAIVEWLGLFLAQVLGGFLAFSGLVDQLGDHIGGFLIIDGIAIKEALRGFRQGLHIGQDCFVRRRLWGIVVADWPGCIVHKHIISIISSKLATLTFTGSITITFPINPLT